MYKMLVCDDEKWIREGIRTAIDWSSMGIDTVLTARDGIQAISMVKEQKPDIVITDIKMPNTGGLEMIETIRKLISPKYIIVISGFPFFEYAQAALKLGVADYILKPINEEALAAAVQKCLAFKQKDSQADGLLVSAVLDRLNLWLNHISTAPPGRDELLSSFGINIENTPFVRAAVCRRVSPGIEALALVKTGIPESSRQVIYLLFQSRDSRFICLFFSERPCTDSFFIEEIFTSNLHGAVREISFTGVGNWAAFTDGWLSYQQAEAALTYSLLFPKQQVFFYDSVVSGKEKPLDTFVGFNLSKPVSLLANRHFARYKAWVDTIFEQINANAGHINPKELKSFFSSLVSSIGRIWELTDGECQEIQHRIETAWQQKELYKELVTFPGKLSLDKDVGIKHNFSLALEYIENNYSRQITMAQTARAIGLNPSYFSSLFSGCAGESFIKFLTRQRMEKAAQMLRKSNEKIYEIAEKVGYTDYRVFSKNFKDYYGVSPADYRNHMV